MKTSNKIGKWLEEYREPIWASSVLGICTFHYLSEIKDDNVEFFNCVVGKQLLRIEKRLDCTGRDCTEEEAWIKALYKTFATALECFETLQNLFPETTINSHQNLTQRFKSIKFKSWRGISHQIVQKVEPWFEHIIYK